jgi:hypothetical protein
MRIMAAGGGLGGPGSSKGGPVKKTRPAKKDRGGRRK